VCASCHGYGMAETSRTVALEIASGTLTGERYQIDLTEGRGNREPGSRRDDRRCLRRRGYRKALTPAVPVNQTTRRRPRAHTP
jgi:hypothetical protein